MALQETDLKKESRMRKAEGLRDLFRRHARKGARLVVDMDFPGMMKPRERKSLCSQINFLYARNKEAVSPFRISLFGLHQEEEEQLFKCGLESWGQWGMTWSREPFTRQIPASQMVYLTADAKVELESIDPAKVYIIGGLVDRNRHKGTTLDKARALSIPTRKFPIKSYLTAQDPHKQFCPKQVLTVNHVVNILIDFQATSNWQYAFSKNLPRRAYKSTEKADAPPVPVKRPKIATEKRKTVVIIGAGADAGRAYARKYLSSGYNLVIVAQDGARVDSIVEQLRSQIEGTDAVVFGYQGQAWSEVDMSRLKYVLMPHITSIYRLILCAEEGTAEVQMDRWIQPLRSLITMLHPTLRLKRTSSDSSDYFLDFKKNAGDNAELHRLILVPGQDTDTTDDLKTWVKQLEKQMRGTGVDETFKIHILTKADSLELEES